MCVCVGEYVYVSVMCVPSACCLPALMSPEGGVHLVGTKVTPIPASELMEQCPDDTHLVSRDRVNLAISPRDGWMGEDVALRGPLSKNAETH